MKVITTGSVVQGNIAQVRLLFISPSFCALDLTIYCYYCIILLCVGKDLKSSMKNEASTLNYFAASFVLASG